MIFWFGYERHPSPRAGHTEFKFLSLFSQDILYSLFFNFFFLFLTLFWTSLTSWKSMISHIKDTSQYLAFRVSMALDTSSQTICVFLLSSQCRVSECGHEITAPAGRCPYIHSSMLATSHLSQWVVITISQMYTPCPVLFSGMIASTHQAHLIF